MDNYINFWDEQAEHNQEHVDVTQNFITDEVFNSRDHLLHWARETGYSLGFILIITSSTKEMVAGRKPKIVIECDRNGNYRAAKPSTMSTSTKKCNCPFRLRGEKLENGDEWKVKVICGFHNHSASLYMEGHPYPGRLSEEEIKLMMEMSSNLVPPRNILASIKKNNPNNVTSMKTLYNTRQKYQVYEHEGRSQMQQLMFQLNKHHYIWWQRTNNETNEVEDLFFAHPRSIDLVRAFPYILFMDATYKTNRFRIPFVQIVGVTSTEMTFSVAFAFIRSEKEENYFWALCCLRNVISGCLLPRVVLTDRDSALRKAINHVFPESTALLCTWHIGNNVATNCKGFFDKATWKKFNQMWYDIVDSETPEDYNLNLLKIEQVFDRYAQAITYIKTFDAIKEKFVAAWTNRSMNYGNRTTNRVEGQHARLKRYLGSSTGNFESVWEKVHSLLDAQFTTIKASLQKSRTYTRHDFKFPIFQNLLGFVSSAGLDYIVEEVKRSNNIGIDYRCGCQIRISHGLPCAHEIAVYRLEGRPIPLSAVDMYWKKLDFAPSTGLDDEDLNCRVELELFSTEFKKKPKPAKMRMLQKIREIINPSTTLVLEPEVKIQTRGRPSSKKKAEASTRRNPSAFEYVENRDAIIVAGRHSCSSIQRFSGY